MIKENDIPPERKGSEGMEKPIWEERNGKGGWKTKIWRREGQEDSKQIHEERNKQKKNITTMKKKRRG